LEYEYYEFASNVTLQTTGSAAADHKTPINSAVRGPNRGPFGVSGDLS